MGGIRLYKGYSKKNIRIGIVKPEPIPEENPVIVIQPTWISNSDLGTFENGEEVSIQLEFSDPSNIVESFILSGSLPPQLMLNTIGGNISGIISDDSSDTYNFIVSMRTVLGDIIQRQFSISTMVFSEQIVWETDSNLGTYNTGDTVNNSIEAYSETVQN
jgi:hypothetical protein